MKRFLTVLLATVLFLFPSALAAVESVSPAYTLTYTFDDRGPRTINEINAALAGLRLSSVSIPDQDGYLITLTVKNGNDEQLVYDYGFLSISLRCEPAGENGGVWQLNAEVYPMNVYPDIATFKEAWRSAHPGQIIESTYAYQYGDLLAFIYLYHEA